MAHLGSSYLAYLPANVQQGDDQDAGLSDFLQAFERILTGYGDSDRPGIEEKLDGIGDGRKLAGSERIFTPLHSDLGRRAPGGAYLDWLANWVALTTRDDWDDDAKRRFISRMVMLYRKRGTRDGMIEMLRAYTGLEANDAVRVEDFAELPNYFQVAVSLGLMATQNDELKRKEQIIRAIIEQEKPAHTFYALKIADIQTWQLGMEGRSQLGVSTMLGSKT